MQLWPEMKLLALNSLQTQYSFSIVENGEAINPFHANVPFLYLLKKSLPGVIEIGVKRLILLRWVSSL